MKNSWVGRVIVQCRDCLREREMSIWLELPAKHRSPVGKHHRVVIDRPLCECGGDYRVVGALRLLTAEEMRGVDLIAAAVNAALEHDALEHDGAVDGPTLMRDGLKYIGLNKVQRDAVMVVFTQVDGLHASGRWQPEPVSRGSGRGKGSVVKGGASGRRSPDGTASRRSA